MSDERYDGPDRRAALRGERSWHLDKRINVGHIMATLTLAAAVMGWGAAMDRRLAVLEEKTAATVIDQKRQDERLESAVSSLRDDIKELLRKMDRFVETRK